MFLCGSAKVLFAGITKVPKHFCEYVTDATQAGLAIERDRTPKRGLFVLTRNNLIVFSRREARPL